MSEPIGFFVPDWIADLWPGEYTRHGSDGSITPSFKDKLLDFARGKVYLGAIPVLDGHLWDSVFRVLVALCSYSSSKVGLIVAHARTNLPTVVLLT